MESLNISSIVPTKSHVNNTKKFANDVKLLLAEPLVVNMGIIIAKLNDIQCNWMSIDMNE